jgi:hypothetical protein
MLISLLFSVQIRIVKPPGPLEVKEERRDQIRQFLGQLNVIGEKEKKRVKRRPKPTSPEMNSTAALVSPSSDAPPGTEQQAAGVGILLQISMLVLSFVLGHVLRRHRFYYLPEASASLLIGKYLSLSLITCD